VNTPRSDEDRLKLMELMVFLLQKGVCDDFGITAARISSYCCQANRFNFSKYIFDSLVRNVDSSSKFYMYPRFIQLIIQAQVGDLSTHTTRFISPAVTQKVFANIRRIGKGFSRVETPLFEGMIAHRQPAEEELGAEQVQVNVDVAAAVIEDVVAEDVAHVLDTCFALLRHVEHLEHDNVAQRLEIVKLKARVKKLEKTDKVKSLKFRRLRKVGTSRRVESSNDMEDVFNQGRMIADMDMNEGIKLEDDSEVQEVVEVVTTTKLITEVVIAAASQVSAVSTTILTASATIPATAPTIVAAYTRRRKGVIIRDLEEELSLKTPAETLKVKDKGKGILVKAPKPMKKKDQIEMDAEYARKLQEEIDRDHDGFNKDVDWDAAMDHVNQKSSSNPQYIKRYQGMKKRPQTESEARKNMMIYLKNIVGYKMDFFKGMSYADICLIFQAMFDENIRKLSEEAQEAEDLRKRLEVVEDEDDDVFVEDTPLASKVPVVDYQIVLIDNKPRYKIIRADDTHQLYISFTTLLKNFNREDLEALWRIVKDRFSTSKPTNFSDEYLLLTLRTMFEESDGQDAIWRNQKSVHGLALVKRWKLLTSCGVHVITLSTVQLFLLVERRYPLPRFTLEQLVNVTRLQVKEESEMSLELLSTPPMCYVEESENSDTFGARSMSSDSIAPLLQDHPLTHTTPVLVLSLRRIAHMVVRVLLAMSPSLSVNIAKVAAMFDSMFRKRFRSSYKSLPSSAPLDLPSRKHSLEDEGPTVGDEGPSAGDEGLAARDEDPGMRVEGLGLGNDEAVPEGQQWAAPVIETTVGEPLGLERVSAFQQPTLTTWIDPEDGRTYIDVLAYPPSTPLAQTPPSPKWSSGLLPISPKPPIIPSPISSPMISLTIPSSIASPATIEARDF
nr:hypothetical protein [Tanacetum cinerariifolium]